MKNIKLNIIEPWELGTEKAIEANIVVGKAENQYLIILLNPRKIKGKEAHYLIAELRNKQDQENFLSEKPGTYTLNMVYSDQVSPNNFEEFKIGQFRSGFLLGEAIL